MSSLSTAALAISCGDNALSVNTADEPVLSFGAVTDLHYSREQYHHRSKGKLAEAIDTFNGRNLDFIIQIGDLIDTEGRENDIECISELPDIFRSSAAPFLHVLGNHDLANLSKEEFCQTVGIEQSWYSLSVAGITLIVLDGNFSQDDVPYDTGNFVWTESNLSGQQAVWLESVLEASPGMAIVFCHQNLDGESADHTVSNAAGIRNILSRSGKVAAVFQGHRHEGGYSRIEEIPYFTLTSMFDRQFFVRNTFAVVKVYQNGKIEIEGFGNQESRVSP